MTNLDSMLKSRGLSSQGYGFSSGHVWMWELGYKESWALKNWCFWTVLEKTLESPLDCKEFQPAHPKGNQSWIFIGRTDVEAETSIIWLPDVKNWLIWKTMMLGKIEGGKRREQQRMRWLDGIAASMGLSLSKLRCWWWTGRPGMLQCMGSQRDTTERLNWNWSLFAQQLKITMNETLGLIMIHVGKISSVSYQNSWKKMERSSSLWILYSYQSISGVTFVLGTVVDGDS